GNEQGNRFNCPFGLNYNKLFFLFPFSPSVSHVKYYNNLNQRLFYNYIDTLDSSFYIDSNI
ncbi:hypothetical protein PCHAJ_000538200, partial [Plasmodium chabaudi chabaudi]